MPLVDTAAFVLASPHFGKDVLTSAGLLLASLLVGLWGDEDTAARTRLAPILLAGCECIRGPAASPTPPEAAAAAHIAIPSSRPSLG